jgi:hypothetical protein
MKNEGDLFGWTPPADGAAYARHTDPDTSHDAAEEVAGTSASRLERIVYECLLDHPQGLTMHEICEKTHLLWNTASPRIRPLTRKELVYDSGERREGPAGKMCIVWKAVIPRGVVGM